MITVELFFTYVKTTPTSAEHGDNSEHGCYHYGREYPIGGCEVDSEDLYDLKDCPEPEQVTAREAVRLVRETVSYCKSALKNSLTGMPAGQLTEISVYELDGSENYRTGENTRITAHIKGHPRLIAAIAKELLK